MDQIKDIKPIVAINDNSLVYFLLIVLVAILMAIFYYWKMSKKRNNERKIAIQQLQNLDFSDSKKTAYGFKKYAEVLCNEDNKTQLEQINNALMQYKYKQRVAELEPALIEQIKDFINAEL